MIAATAIKINIEKTTVATPMSLEKKTTRRRRTTARNAFTITTIKPVPMIPHTSRMVPKKFGPFMPPE